MFREEMGTSGSVWAKVVKGDDFHV